MDDKDRISEIMNRKGMLAKNFCEVTGISPASLSHILNGKTKASLPVLKSIVDAFPDFNPLWVLLGEGEMFLNPNQSSIEENDSSSQVIDNVQEAIPNNRQQHVAEQTVNNPVANPRNTGLLFDFSEPQQQNQNSSKVQPKQRIETTNQTVNEVVKIIEKKTRKIVEIRVFYDDGTYETFN